MQIEVRVVWHGAGPDIAPWKTHHMMLKQDPWTPGDSSAFPFHMVQWMGDGNIEPLDIYARVVHHQHNGQSPAGLADAILARLRVVFFDLQTLDDESIPWNYVEGQSIVQFNSLSGGATLTGQLPLVSPDDDGSDYWPLFWDVEVIPREPGQPYRIVGTPPNPGNYSIFYDPFRLNQWRCIPHVMRSGGTTRSTWQGKGYASRQTPTVVRDRFHVGGNYLHHFPAGETTDYFEIRGFEDTSYGDSDPLGVPQTTTKTASTSYAMFTFAAHKLNLRFAVPPGGGYYGPPREHELEFLDAVTTPLQIEWTGDQTRPRTAFFDGVPRAQYPNRGVALAAKTGIGYSFAESIGAGEASGDAYAYQYDETEHTWDNETVPITEIVGANSIEARGEWSPSTVAAFRQESGPDSAEVLGPRFWTIEQKTGIPPFSIPDPQPGADLYLSPQYEALDAGQLPTLPKDPVGTLRYGRERDVAKLRADAGDLVTWPLYAEPEVKVEFVLQFDLADSADKSLFDDLYSMLGSSSPPAFQFTPHGATEALPYLVDLSSVDESPKQKKLVAVRFSAFQLRFTGP